jgi:hypothetical protein
MAKQVTFDQAERKRQQAVSFLGRIGSDEAADQFASMTTQEYADHKGLRIASQSNPKGERQMAATTTKADLQDVIDRAIEVLDDAYSPETTREDLAGAVGEALDILNGEDEEEDDDDLDGEDGLD